MTALIDHDGNVVVKYTYDSWGNVRKIEGSLADTIGVQNPFRYRGYYFDQETGMYYLKNRYYDPKLRRFICADSLKALKAGEDFGGKNLYVYCNGNPVAMLDDEGEFAIAMAANLVKMAVGAVVNVATPQNLVSFLMPKIETSTAVSAAADAAFGFAYNSMAAVSVKAANQKKRWMPGRIIAYVSRYYPKTGITKLEPVYLKGYFY